MSVATVSRALRGLPNVAESTRLRVLEVAGSMDYEPDPAAARLAAGRTKTVLVLVPHLASWYFSTVIAGAEAVCNESGYEFLVIGVGTLDESGRLLGDSARIERRADGIVLVNIPATDAQAASLHDRGVALSTIGTRAPGAPSVFIDDVEVGRIGARTLIELGHRRIGLISGLDEDPLNFEVPKRRTAGFEEVILASGLPLDPALVVGGSFGIDGGQEAMSALLDLAEPPTAVFAMSDEMAFGALMELEAPRPAPGRRRLHPRRRRSRHRPRARAVHDPPGRGITGRGRGPWPDRHDDLAPDESRSAGVADRTGPARDHRTASLRRRRAEISEEWDVGP